MDDAVKSNRFQRFVPGQINGQRNLGTLTTRSLPDLGAMVREPLHRRPSNELNSG